MSRYRYCPFCASPLSLQQRDGKDYPSCNADGCRFVQWDNPVPVVAGLVELDNKIVLARNASWPAGMLSIITGFLESGERPEQGIIRETKEELNLDTQQLTFIGHYPFTQQNQLILAYHVKASGTVKLGAELAEYKLIEKHKLKPWPMGTGLAVKDWLDRQTPNN